MNFEQETYTKHQKAYTLENPALKGKEKQYMSMPTDFREAKLYFDFLLQYRYTKLREIHFTQPGFFEKFQIALDHTPTYRWTDEDRYEFLQVWPNIEYAFQKSYENALSISAADALVILLERFTFDQIAAMDTWVLARMFQAYWKELYQLSFPNAITAETKKTVGVLQTA